MSSPAQDSGEPEPRDADPARPDHGPTRPVHQPVLLREVIRFLDLRPGLTVVDATVGGGGHAQHILKQIGPEGKLIGLDRDPMMIRLAARRLGNVNCSLHQASYASLHEILGQLGLSNVDRVLLDLGLSSDQLADAGRGFRFDSAGPLDLRFDPTVGDPAWKLIEQLDLEQLTDLFRRFGEERFSGRIAQHLVDRRTGTDRTKLRSVPLIRPVHTARDLSEAVQEAVPAAQLRTGRQHPATRVFQALRIAVNDELEHLERFLRESLFRSLSAGGRAVVISFHSLEDRLVKTEFRNEKRWQNLTKQPITPTAVEQKVNPRCRSAKLRAARRKPDSESPVL